MRKFAGSIFSLVLFLGAAVEADTRIGVMSGQRWSDDVTLDDSVTGLEEAQSLSAVLEWKYSGVADWQLYLSQFDTQLQQQDEPGFDFTVAQIGGLRWIENGTFRPYVGATGGATELIVADDSLTRFSLSLFGGFHWDLGKNVGLRAEARWIGTLIDSDVALACVNGSCLIAIDSGVWSQTEVAAGLFVQF